MRNSVWFMCAAVVAMAPVWLVSNAAAEPGISDKEILLGQTAVFSGPSAGLGVELYRGMAAVLKATNDSGGVLGRKLTLRQCDDTYDPKTVVECARTLVEKEKVFLLTNSVGTPTMVAMLPLLEHWKDDHVILFGNFTGAQPQRKMPYAPYVFNVRASYHEETEGHVRACAVAGLVKIGTFVQNDAYGFDGENGVNKALSARNMQLVAKTYYERHTAHNADMSAQVRELREKGVNCVSTTGSYQAIAAFVKAARDSGWDAPIYGVSFTGADQLLQFLKSAGPHAMDRVFLTQVVPPPSDTRVSLVAEYRAAMEKYRIMLPPAPFDTGGYASQNLYSFGSLEGYLNTKLLVEALKRTGSAPTRVAFRDAAESIKNFDAGLGPNNLVTWGKVSNGTSTSAHQALSSIWFTTIKHGAWVPVAEGEMQVALNPLR